MAPQLNDPNAPLNTIFWWMNSIDFIATFSPFLLDKMATETAQNANIF